MNMSCRICRRTSLIESIPLDYISEFCSGTVRNMIEFIIGLEDNTCNDMLPQQICRPCMASLTVGFELKRLCIESETFFRQQLLSSQVEPLHNDQLSLEEQTKIDDVPEMEDVKHDLLPTDDDNLENLLSLDKIKIDREIMIEDSSAYLQQDEDYPVEKDAETETMEAQRMFYCCFSGCNVVYQFEELLVEHSNKDHRREKRRNTNAHETNDFASICIVCGCGFENEALLIEHRQLIIARPYRCTVCHFKTKFKSEYDKHVKLHEGRIRVCICGYETNRTFCFKRHQRRSKNCEALHAKRMQQESQKIVQSEIIPDEAPCDKTNDEIIALGFKITRHTTMFYCCVRKCIAVCETQEEMKEHFEQSHSEMISYNMQLNNNPLRCQTCFLGFVTENALQAHQEDAYSPTFRCDACRCYLYSRKSAVAHSETTCSKDLFRCSCGLTTNRLFTLKRHVKSKGCPVLEENVKALNRTRIRRHHACLRCTKSFVSSSALDLHKKSGVCKSRLEKKLYSCEYCGEARSSAKWLRRHKELEWARALKKQAEHDPGHSVDGRQDKVYSCRWCGEVTGSIRHLVQCMIKHSKRHANRINHSKTTTGKHQLGTHTTDDGRESAGRKSFPCPHCPKIWKYPNSLTKHISVAHIAMDQLNTPKLFVCHICGQRFSRQFSRNRHMKVHLGQPWEASPEVLSVCNEEPTCIKVEMP